MDDHREPFCVVCFSLACTWREECETDQDARRAAAAHEQDHAGHMTYVFRPDVQQAAA